MPDACLEPDEILAHHAGLLEPARREAVQRHLAACDECRAAVHALADSTEGKEAISGEEQTLPARRSSGKTAIEHPAPGVRVGRYEVRAPLGAGGMGEVFLAHDPELDRPVALKLLRPMAEGREDMSRRLVREAQALARVSHPAVVGVYEVGTWGESVFIAMEYVPGETLRAWLRRRRSLRQVIEAYRRAGEGLAAAHRAGLVHRDFKPDNVLITAEGAVRVVDFGLARPAATPEAPSSASGKVPTPLDEGLTATGALVGTPRYMAPEQFRGGAVDARTDQFAFCVSLYEAVYGERPFDGADEPELRAAVVAGRLRPRPAGSPVPAWLDQALRQGLQPEPRQRHASMEALLELLDRGLEAGDALSPRWRGERRLALAASVAVPLAVAALGATSAFRSFEERAEGLVLAARPRPWNDKVVVLAQDNATVNALGWPPPRRVLARVVEALTVAGVRVIAWDGFFQLPAPDGPDGDQQLAEASAAHGRVVFAAPCTLTGGDDPEAEEEVLGVHSLAPGATPALRCEHIAPPRIELAAAGHLAQVQVARSDSGNVRGTYLLAQAGSARLPSLALAALALGRGVGVQEIAQERGAVRVDGQRIPVGEDGAALASFRLPYVDSVISLAELVAALPPEGRPAELPPALEARLRDRYVIFGQTAEVIHDTGSFAHGQHLPLVLLHGMHLADLLEDRPVREVPVGAQLAGAWLLGVLLAVAAWRLRPALAVAGYVCGLLGVMGGALLAVDQAGWLMGPLLPALAGTAGFAVAALGRAGLAERRRQTVRAALGSGAPELTGPRTDSWLALEGARKHLAVMCVRVDLDAGSGRLSPERVVSRTRRALGEVSRVVATHGGRVEAVGGESVLSIFGDPLPTSGHVRSALAAAIDARTALAGLTAPAEAGDVALSFSIGVAAGEAVVGDVGGREGELTYRVLGPVVDEAWRLCRSAPEGSVRVNGTVQLAAALDGKPHRPVSGVPDAFDLEGAPP